MFVNGMTVTKWLLLPLLILLAVGDAAGNKGYVTMNDDVAECIDNFVEKVLACREIVGLNLAVVHGNVTLMAKGYGLANIDNQQCVDDVTTFGIASLTKAFAATLLGILVDKNDEISWDTKVKAILGEDFHFNDVIRTEEMTLRDLLTHRTGIPPNNYARLQQPTREELAQKIRFFEPTGQFRGSYIYNNLMYGLISYISEVIGGKSWEDLMREHIFLPLGMTYTSFTHEADLNKPDVAVPYLPDVDEWRSVSWKLHSEWGELGGSGSILSNALDMAKWLKMQLNLGVSSQGLRVVSEHIMEDTHTPMNVVPEVDSTKVYRKPYAPETYEYNTYGLGWRQGYYRGHRIVTHTGTSWGYGALLTLVPDLNIGIHTSITGPDTGYKGRRNIHLYILDMLLGENPWLNMTNTCSFPNTGSRRFLTFNDEMSSVLPLEEYVGTYGNFGYGNISVVLPANSSNLHMYYGDLGKWELHPTKVAHKFVADGLEDVWSMDLANLMFETNQEGDAIDKLIIASFESRLPPVFIKDLKMSSAPGPPELCPKAEKVVSSSVGPDHVAL